MPKPRSASSISILFSSPPVSRFVLNTLFIDSYNEHMITTIWITTIIIHAAPSKSMPALTMAVLSVVAAHVKWYIATIKLHRREEVSQIASTQPPSQTSSQVPHRVGGTHVIGTLRNCDFPAVIVGGYSCYGGRLRAPCAPVRSETAHTPKFVSYYLARRPTHTRALQTAS